MAHTLQRVVVTGIGLLTPLGLTRQASFERLLRAEGAVRPAAPEITQWLPNALSADVDPAFAQPLDRNAQGLDRATQFALLASREALADARAEAWDLDPDRVGVYAGIGLGGATTGEALYKRLHESLQAGRNPTVMHPLSVPRLMPNAATAAISMAHQFRGPTHTYSVACSSSAMALGEACRTIRHGYADAIVVVGAEAMNVPGVFMAWNALRVMAKPHPDNPAASCRPFDKDRSGFVLAEGAAALVLETAESALRRGATIYGELCGYGSSSDAEHLTLPSSAGQYRAIRMALDEAGMAPEAIDYLNAHGTATEAGDVIESETIAQVFGDHARRLPVSSTKALHGHLIGAAGATEFAFSVLALHSGSIPPTAYLDHPDPRCALDYVPREARHGQKLRAVMSNSFAFGGSNVSLIARRYA
ncbi:MAG: beta-ketoacyl-[acyl-carrier-protein] synthase family protein [Hylemonella sp.]|uniref:beta-ketoacyl-[acyl-carrier-protein] synthase family protein n=1 Tax=Hylemonella sp. TaxID=2066020 RepID=UPI0022BF1DA3|nr:beta-ketoacyl-[acyl-carrier-protein] synthase family protein [Hylemonella sp.]MCZ8251448.1 beta-ketoacyl-[acyl-carrier-protein] synthase family protein [Hylemonella sp.]